MIHNGLGLGFMADLHSKVWFHYTEKCSYVVNLHSTNSGQTHFKGQSAADEKVPLKWDSTVFFA